MGAFEWYTPSGEYLSRQAASLTSNFLVKCQKAHIYLHAWGECVVGVVRLSIAHSAAPLQVCGVLYAFRPIASRISPCARAMKGVAVRTHLRIRLPRLACPIRGSYSALEKFSSGSSRKVASIASLMLFLELEDEPVACPPAWGAAILRTMSPATRGFRVNDQRSKRGI